VDVEGKTHARKGRVEKEEGLNRLTRTSGSYGAGCEEIPSPLSAEAKKGRGVRVTGSSKIKTTLNGGIRRGLVSINAQREGRRVKLKA